MLHAYGYGLLSVDSLGLKLDEIVRGALRSIPG